MAVTDKAKGSKEYPPSSSKGKSRIPPRQKENKLGMRASDTSEVVFTDCFIPSANLLGAEGQGLRKHLQVLDGGRVSIAALALGMAQGAYEAAVKYAKQRKQFGKTISEFQAIQFKLADMPPRSNCPPAGVSRRVARRPEKPALHEGIEHGKAVRQRGRCARGERSGADFRRLRFHQGLSCGEILSRLQTLHHSAKAPAKFSALSSPGRFGKTLTWFMVESAPRGQSFVARNKPAPPKQSYAPRRSPVCSPSNLDSCLGFRCYAA